MNERLDDLDTVRFTRATHEVTNQPEPLVGYNAWTGDPTLRATVFREGGGWVDEQAASLGDLVGGERMQLLANQANRRHAGAAHPRPAPVTASTRSSTTPRTTS